MGKYIKVDFDARYNNESSVERYDRLRREVKPKLAACLVNLRDQLNQGSINEDEKEKCIELYEKQADNLLIDIDNCWRLSQTKDCILPRFQSAIAAESYLIETLARIGVAFEQPTDPENTTQLLLLAQEIPGNEVGSWHELKGGLILLATIAVCLLAVFSTIALLGPAAPVGLVLLAVFLPDVLGVTLMMREMVPAKMAFHSQPVKSGIDSIVKEPSFFAPTDSPSESTAETKKTVLEAESSDPVKATVSGKTSLV